MNELAILYDIQFLKIQFLNIEGPFEMIEHEMIESDHTIREVA